MVHVAQHLKTERIRLREIVGLAALARFYATGKPVLPNSAVISEAAGEQISKYKCDRALNDLEDVGFLARVDWRRRYRPVQDLRCSCCDKALVCYLASNEFGRRGYAPCPMADPIQLVSDQEFRELAEAQRGQPYLDWPLHWSLYFPTAHGAHRVFVHHSGHIERFWDQVIPIPHAETGDAASQLRHYSVFDYSHPAVVEARAKAFSRSGGVCQFCGNKPATQAHHWRQPLYLEEELTTPDELIALCGDCHAVATQRRQWYAGIERRGKRFVPGQ